MHDNREPGDGPVCDSVLRCKGWENSMKQILVAQEIAENHGMKYTGDAFKWCPWCGKERTWEKGE